MSWGAQSLIQTMSPSHVVHAYSPGVGFGEGWQELMERIHDGNQGLDFLVAKVDVGRL